MLSPDKRPRNRQRQASALKRRMKELALTEVALRERLGLESRVAIAKWKAAETWPRLHTEVRLEQVLQVARGFFLAISQGADYDQARLGVAEHQAFTAALDDLMRHFLYFFGEHGQKWEHIERQILLFGQDLLRDHPEVGEGKLTLASAQAIMAALQRIAREEEENE